MFFNHSCYKTRLILLSVKNLIVDNISECNRVKMLRIIIRYAHLQCNDITSVTAAVLMSLLLKVREAVLRQLTAGPWLVYLRKCEKSTMSILWNTDAGSFHFD